jgi:hypothetical protein
MTIDDDLAAGLDDLLIKRIEHANRYVPTPDGIKFALFYIKVHSRLLRPLIAADQSQAPPELRRVLGTLNRHVDDYISRASLGRPRET